MKNNTFIWTIAVLIVGLGIAAMLFLNSGTKPPEPEVPETTAPAIDSWEAYLALSPEEQDAYFLKFGSVEAFEAWMDSVKPEETTLPDFVWDKEGKLPDAYTWEEYQALSLEEKEAFYRWFDTEAAFEIWMAAVKFEEDTNPFAQWDKDGKQPDQYTWEEYQVLSAEEKEAFFQWFETGAAFETWMKNAQPSETTETLTFWNKPGKYPWEYTWEEYQALSHQEQEEFFRWFGSKGPFENWMNQVKPTEPTVAAPTWNKAGKTPDRYTWEEYEALSFEEQDAFYNWFDSQIAFEAWLNAAKPAEEAVTELSWNKPGKKPDDYSWEEYESLTPQEQDAFYRWFGSVEAFEAWMNAVKPQNSDSGSVIWNKPGKDPDAYTWEEYQALSPQDQERFFQWFGSVETFEAWMENAKAMAAKTWNKPGKLPDQYTKEEYLALSQEEKEAFVQWFDTLEAFEAWVNKVA